MKRLVPLFLVVVIVTAAVVMAFRLRLHQAATERAPVIPESLPPAPDMDSIPGDTLFLGDLMKHRQRIAEIFRGEKSPLDEPDRAAFRGLNYFPPNPDSRFQVKLQPPARQDTVALLDTSGAERKYVRAGILRFNVEGRPESLTVFREPFEKYLFLPFKDTTAGKETYEVGRYVDVEPVDAEPDVYLIDFNLAYNPYCAYSHRWSCPIPPPENVLSVPIRAGEKKFHTGTG